MGIDVYTRWDGQTEDEREAQVTGFSVVSGHVGYLREAYHGEPYATRVLLPEAFVSDGDSGVAIPAATLRKRLPATLAAARERQRRVYRAREGDDDPVVMAFVRFVELIERLEAEGKNPRIVVSW
jgi:hypothetical protein